MYKKAQTKKLLIMRNLPDDAVKYVRRASWFAIGFGVLKILVTALMLVAFDTARAMGFFMEDVLLTIVAGVLLLSFGLRLKWRSGSPQSTLLILQLIAGGAALSALLAERPLKLGIDVLLIGVFVLAYRSVPSNTAGSTSSSASTDTSTREESQERETEMMNQKASQPKNQDTDSDCSDRGGEREVGDNTTGDADGRGWSVVTTIGKWVGIAAATVVVLVIVAGGVTYSIRSHEVQSLRETRSFYASTPHFDIDLSVQYQSQGIIEGIIEDRGSVRYQLQVSEGTYNYDFKSPSVDDRVTIRFLDDEEFLVEDWGFYLGTMTGVVDDEGKRIGLSELGSRRGITAREYQEVSRIEVVWSLATQR